MMHLISLERLPFTIAYVLSLAATLWAALGVSCGCHSDGYVIAVVNSGSQYNSYTSIFSDSDWSISMVSKTCHNVVVL